MLEAPPDVKGPTVPLSEISVEQLSQLQKQVEQELAFFQESAVTLKGFLEKNVQSIQALNTLKQTSSGHQALIPLSESMYIRAELSDPSKTLVEIGTGYFAEMDREKAMELFDRKRKYIANQIETLEKIVSDKKRTRAVISENLQQKISAQLASMPAPSK